MKRKSSDPIGVDDGNDSKVPKYGTKEYWEARYKSHLPGVSVDDTSYTLDGVVLSKEAITAGHEWYFTYDELKPLIMPLILGDLNNEVAESDYDECSDAESWVEEEEEGGEGSDAEPKAENDCSTNDSTCDKTNDNTEEDLEDQEPDIDTTNLKPKRVLEIGCGDVPIATSLMSDLLSMQQSESNAKLIEEVTCIDYSEVVIETLIKQQKKLEQEQQNSGKKDNKQLQPTFQALDARSLPFEQNTYDLVLEKGTMDAMLSDEVDGIPNCIKIVEEMARVTSEGGAILIVSHLNANEDKGMGWLEDIVFSGLKDEFLERRKQKREETKSTKDTDDDDDDEKEYVWSVEVHGGEGKYLDEKGEEIENPSEDDTPTYGACVYIIKKKSVPASIARDLFGKKKKDTITEDSKTGKVADEGDANSDDEKLELMEMPPVKLEFVTY